MVLTVDALVLAGWLIPVAPDPKVVLRNHAIAVNAGKILDILPLSDALTKYSCKTKLDRSKSVVMPGFVNAHTHTGMTLMRGRVDDLPLLEWLHSIWPMEAVFAHKDEFCYDGALLAIAEMVRGGVTCFADMYWSPDAAARAVLETGVRGVIGMILIGFPSGYATDLDGYIDKGHQAMHRYQGEQRITFAYAPHAPYTVGTEAWERLRDLSADNGCVIHTHLHETREECSASLVLDRSNPACHKSENMCHPLEDFRRKGLLSQKLVAVHMVHLTDEEIEMVAEKGVHVAHCPSSNSKLASGFCPVHKLIDAGVNIGLGTDSAVSNNSLSMFQEMRQAALNTKNISGDATKVPAWQAIEMATINGAKMFGIDTATGSLEVGKSADLICIDVQNNAGNAPMFNAHSAVVYAAAREDVTDVMVEGQLLLRDKEYCTMDLGDILRRMEYWQGQLEEKFPSN